MDELEFVFPVGDFWEVIIKIVLIIVEVRQGFPVICHNSLAAVDVWRAMVANNIKNDLEPLGMEGVN